MEKEVGPVPARTPVDWEAQDKACRKLYDTFSLVMKKYPRDFPMFLHDTDNEQGRRNILGIVNVIGRPGKPPIDYLNRLTPDEMNEAASRMAIHFGVEVAK